MKKDPKNAAEQRENLARAAAKVEQLWAGLDPDYVPSNSSNNRFEVPEPEPKDKSKYNQNNIVDIETFLTHPFYLNLKPYPWQVLALKLFYAGSEGNTNLEFNDSKKTETDGCKGCVWEYILENEKDCAEKTEKEEYYESILQPTNSRCLKCSRCPLMVRKNRLEHEIQVASDKFDESMLEDILTTEVEDLYQSEFDLIDEIPDEVVKMQIKKKLRNKFQELVLIIGRRGSKSFITVIIALYELHKLIKMGHPQRKLKLPDFQEIHIINVAKNQDQAKDSIFTPLKSHAVSSPFFQKHVGVDNELELKFLTDKDLEENERRKSKGMATLGGTLVCQCGSSSAGGLVGKTCWIVILDELAAMAGDNANSGIDAKLYNELKPSLAQFGTNGKIVCLSNPKGPFGQLFYLYKNRIEDPTTLIIKVPTWQFNANAPLKYLESEKKKNIVEYNMQYGAEFGSNSQDPLLTAEDVEYAFDNSSRVTRCEGREQLYDYYCHIDPANRSDYYAISVVHAVPSDKRGVDNKPIKKFYVDHLHFWAPEKMGQPVPIEEVEKYIIDLHYKFRFKQITFDQWGSVDTIQKLSNLGIPAILRPFNKEYKDKIYLNLLEVFRDRRIEFYQMSGGQVKNSKGSTIDINEIPEAKNQFLFLQKKWKDGRQIIGALPGQKDDLCDATAAAIFECGVENVITATYPRARIAYTGGRIR
jgi:hypothetical protein